MCVREGMGMIRMTENGPEFISQGLEGNGISVRFERSCQNRNYDRQPGLTIWVSGPEGEGTRNMVENVKDYTASTREPSRFVSFFI